MSRPSTARRGRPPTRRWSPPRPRWLPEPEPTAVLGIDETRFGPVRWILDGITWRRSDPWLTSFMDCTPGHPGALLGLAPGRTGGCVRDWLGEQSQTKRVGCGYRSVDLGPVPPVLLTLPGREPCSGKVPEEREASPSERGGSTPVQPCSAALTSMITFASGRRDRRGVRLRMVCLIFANALSAMNVTQYVMGTYHQLRQIEKLPHVQVGSARAADLPPQRDSIEGHLTIGPPSPSPAGSSTAPTGLSRSSSPACAGTTQSKSKQATRSSPPPTRCATISAPPPQRLHRSGDAPIDQSRTTPCIQPERWLDFHGDQ
jgi:hypothetical protein